MDTVEDVSHLSLMVETIQLDGFNDGHSTNVGSGE
jgi:hypothetical protein